MITTLFDMIKAGDQLIRKYGFYKNLCETSRFRYALLLSFTQNFFA